LLLLTQAAADSLGFTPQENDDVFKMAASLMQLALKPVARKVNVVRFEVFTAVTMENVVFWDIKTQFVLHRRHITSPLHSTAG
jgi:hypothetical protein